MSVHLENELNILRKDLLRLSGLVEDNLLKALSSLNDNLKINLCELKNNDKIIDKLEVEVEEECLKLLALHQPVANDLRYIICILKMNNDLERIGDLAVNIAKYAIKVDSTNPTFKCIELSIMGQAAMLMVRDALTSLINSDADLAKEICSRDDSVDEAKNKILTEISECIVIDPKNINEYLAVIFVARNIERIADLATNICEDVIYSLKGEIIRHNL